MKTTLVPCWWAAMQPESDQWQDTSRFIRPFENNLAWRNPINNLIWNKTMHFISHNRHTAWCVRAAIKLLPRWELSSVNSLTFVCAFFFYYTLSTFTKLPYEYVSILTSSLLLLPFTEVSVNLSLNSAGIGLGPQWVTFPYFPCLLSLFHLGLTLITQ